MARKSNAQNEKDELGQTKLTKASDDPSKDAAADTSSPNNSVASKKNKSADKPTVKKAAKKPTKTSSLSDEDGSDGSKTIKADAKKPARGRKPKSKMQTNSEDVKSDDVDSGTTVKKRAQKSSTKKVKKSAASKREDTSMAPANRIAEGDNQAANRNPISSAPQDIIDVGSAAPDARKRGWWSRG